MTMPTLIKNHEKHVIETQLKKTYSDIGNWIKRSEVDNGPAEYWDYTLGNFDFVEKYFAPYVNLKECNRDLFKNNICFQYLGNSSGWYYTNGTFQPYNPAGFPTYVLTDGRVIAFQNNTDYERIYIAVDVNGAKGKSVLGKDVFMLTFFNYNFLSFNLKGKLLFGDIWNGRGHAHRPTEDIINECKNGNIHCGILLQRNGWKFPEDYPIKF